MDLDAFLDTLPSPAADAPATTQGAAPEPTQGESPPPGTAPEQPPAGQPAEEPPATSTETEPAAKTPPDQSEAGPVALDDALFSDEALSTPEGLKAARDAVAKARAETDVRARKSHEVYLRLNKRERKLRAEREAVNREKETLSTIGREVLSDVELLQKGSAQERLDALGRITRSDGRQVFEAMARVIAVNGKAPKPSPEVEALQRKLEELERRREADLAAQEAERNRALLEQRKAQLVQVVTNDPSAYPIVSNIAQQHPKEVADRLVLIKTQAHEQGRPLSDKEAAAALERELRGLYAPPSQNGAAGTPSPDAGLAPSAPATAAKPVAGGLPGQSLPQRVTTESSSRRELTDEERLAELAADDNFWRRFPGFG